MKLEFSLKNKEASLEADVEGLVEKGLEYNSKKPDKRTRYQIKQEEKRKNEELKHKQQMKYQLHSQCLAGHIRMRKLQLLIWKQNLVK